MVAHHNGFPMPTPAIAAAAGIVTAATVLTVSLPVVCTAPNPGAFPPEPIRAPQLDGGRTEAGVLGRAV
jgi:hypothetical protein